jgi:hypothetical protein
MGLFRGGITVLLGRGSTVQKAAGKLLLADGFSSYRQHHCFVTRTTSCFRR